MYEGSEQIINFENGETGFKPRTLDELVDFLDIGAEFGLQHADITHDIQNFTTFGPESKWPI